MIDRMRPLAWLRAHPWATDVAITAVATAAAVALHLWGLEGIASLEGSDPYSHMNFSERDPSWWTTVLVALCGVPLIGRRRHPLLTIWSVWLVYSLVEALQIYSGGWIPALVAVYSVGAYAEGRRRTWTVAILAIVSVGASAATVNGWIDSYDDNLSFASTGASMAVLAASLFVGDNIRRRRQNLVNLAERADRAERERDLMARERVTEERARIARELHDIVAHSVSGIIIHAQAARRSIDDDPATSRDLLTAIEHTGRQAMDELRRVLGVLRSDGEESGLTPQPSLADVDELIHSNEDLPITFEMSGELDRLPAGIGLAVYRILQEAFTNIRRHAGRVTHVGVTLALDAGGLRLTVDDDGRGVASTVDRDGQQGYGLVGMNERVAATGGVLATGPRPGGGWRVTARFPNGAPPP